MTRDELLDRSDESLARALVLRARSVPGAAWRAGTHSVCVAIGAPSLNGHLNAAFYTRAVTGPGALLDDADAFFQTQQRGYVLWVRDHADFRLEQQARTRALPVLRTPGTAGMLLSRELPQPSLPDHVRMRRVETALDAMDFARVARQAFALPARLAASLFGEPARLCARDAAAFVAYLDARPVAVSSVFVDGALATVHWVGTIPNARQHGLGAQCTIAAVQAGHALGATAVFLQASPRAEPLYARLGFDTVTRYRWYHGNPQLRAPRTRPTC